LQVSSKGLSQNPILKNSKIKPQNLNLKTLNLNLKTQKRGNRLPAH
jgi:hypothetical protein